MILRPRQKIFVNKCVAAIRKHGNTLGVAIVGFGKTFSLSAVIDIMHKKHNVKKTLVLQHRIELKEQNSSKFNIATENKYKTSYVQGDEKDFSGEVVFGMIQTVSRNLSILPKFDFVGVDEVHHITSNTYAKTIEKLLELNPSLKLFGVTATTQRGDGVGLGKVFNNVADIVSIEETIRAGHLVSPKTYQMDLGVSGLLEAVSKTSTGEYNHEEVAEILDAVEINAGVLKHWREIAEGRKTIAFCSSVEHAKNLKDLFSSNGVKCALVHGAMSDKDRKSEIYKYEHGDADVMFNVAVLTEGYDYQPTSCIMLLRQSSFKGTMIQMIGRGLRVVDNKEFPGVIKADCIVLDFGLTTSIHGSLETDVSLEDREVSVLDEEEQVKFCPECVAEMPSSMKICPMCGFEYKKIESMRKELKLPADFTMVEVNLMAKSTFLFENFSEGSLFVATGFESFAIVCKDFQGNWRAVGGEKNKQLQIVSSSSRQVCLSSANDWMNEKEPSKDAGKTKAWVKRMATSKQRQLISRFSKESGMNLSLTRYRAACKLTFIFNKEKLIRLLKK